MTISNDLIADGVNARNGHPPIVPDKGGPGTVVPDKSGPGTIVPDKSGSGTIVPGKSGTNGTDGGSGQDYDKEIIRGLLNNQKQIDLIGNEGKYHAVEIIKAAGEGTVYKCTSDREYNAFYAAKIYYRQINEDDGEANAVERRTKVQQFSKSRIAQDKVVPIIDQGNITIYDKETDMSYVLWFEIMPYYPGGDMGQYQNHFTFAQMKNVIRQLTENLQMIHNAGFFHMDVKPDNLFYDGGKILIGDFGVAQEQKEGKAFIDANAPATIGFTAPEIITARNTQLMQNEKASKGRIFVNEKADLFSLGPTIASIYIGHSIWEDCSTTTLTTCLSNGDLPEIGIKTEDIQIYNLCRGLFCPIPNNRWGFSEIEKWLNDTRFDGNNAGNLTHHGWAQAIRFNGKEHESPKELYDSIARNWNKGKQTLYAKAFENPFGMVGDSDMQATCKNIVESDYPMNQDMGLFVFLLKLFPAGGIAWKGYVWKSLYNLADDALRDSAVLEECGELLANGALSLWLAESPIEEGRNSDSYQSTMLELQNQEALANQVGRPCVAAYWLCADRAKSSNKAITIYQNPCKSLGDIIGVSLQTATQFYLISKNISIDSQVEESKLLALLCALGYYDAVKLLINNAKEKKHDIRGIALDFLYFLWASAAKDADAQQLMNKVRTFACRFGPNAYLLWWQSAIMAGKTYVALSALAQEKSNRIISIAPRGDADDLQGYMDCFFELENEYNGFCTQVQNNPYLAFAGLAEEKEWAISNCQGFIDSIFIGKSVPNGYTDFYHDRCNKIIQ